MKNLCHISGVAVNELMFNETHEIKVSDLRESEKARLRDILENDGIEVVDDSSNIFVVQKIEYQQ